jgi:chitinase
MYLPLPLIKDPVDKGRADHGRYQLSDEWADTQMPVDGTTGCLRAFAQLKPQYSKLKLILSIGGGGKGSENFAAVARSKSCTETFAQSARRLVDEFGLDGIDGAYFPLDHMLC